MFSRTVTDELVETQLACPDGGSYVSHELLRHLALRDLASESADGLTVRQLRALLVRHLAVVEGCFRELAASAELDMRALISSMGHALSIDASAMTPAEPAVADAARCARETIAMFEFPRAEAPTVVHWRYAYRVEDPRAYAKPLACP